MEYSKHAALCLFSLLVMAFVGSCQTRERMPEVNDTNCKAEVYINIQDNDIRTEFTKKCQAVATQKAVEGESAVQSSHKSY